MRAQHKAPHDKMGVTGLEGQGTRASGYASNLVMRELDATAAGGPIGTRLAAWRKRRGMARNDLASRAGLPLSYVSGLETGRDWVDRRGVLAALAAALRLDTTDLTGQPYPPSGNDHAVVRAVAFHLRRWLAQPVTGTEPGGPAEALAARVQAAAVAEAAGDEQALALALPDLIQAADLVVTTAASHGRDEAARLRVDAHVLAAGLLRRTGYKDLAWMLLHRARPGISEPLPVLVEEVRLLIDLGLPEYALARAERAEGAWEDPDLPVLSALAQAMAGRRQQAEQWLAAGAERAADARALARVAAGRAAVAAELGDSEEAAGHARTAELAVLTGAERSRLLTIAAVADARRGRIARATVHLAAAEAAAPLRLRLDPFARELVSTLPARTTDAGEVGTLRAIAERAGLR